MLPSASFPHSPTVSNARIMEARKLYSTDLLLQRVCGCTITKGLLRMNERYKLGFGDVLHAMMSLVVFLAIAFSDHRVIDCLFPKHVNDVEQVMHVLVLVVGFVCSFLFLLFPVYRRGFVPTLPKNCSSSH